MGHEGRRWAAVLAALVLVMAGCGEKSRVAPDEAVVISGQVVDATGRPAVGVPVRLGVGVTSADGAFAALTLGLHCTTGACSGAIQDGSTGSRGGYRFELEGRDTQSSFGQAEPVLVTATGEPTDGEVSGPLTSARFRAQRAAVRLPVLELVDPGLDMGDSGGVTAWWEPTQPGPYELSFEAGEALPVWRAIVGSTSAAIDPRFLEGTSGQVVVSGRAEEAIEGSTVAVTWRSGGVPYASAVGPPPSRGRPCRGVAPSGAASAPARRCGLTDGDLTGPSPIAGDCPAGAPCEAPTAVQVDLEAPVPAELVVVRGCEGGCGIEVSADGATFRPAGATADGFGAVALDGTPITTVRVGLGGATAGLREISVWGPTPSPALRSVGHDDRSDISAPYRADVDDDPPLLPALLAGAAILLTAVAGAVALGRRRAGSGPSRTLS